MANRYLIIINSNEFVRIPTDRNEAEIFIRIGKSLIINKNYIYSINPNKQQLILSDRHFQYYFELTASKERRRLMC